MVALQKKIASSPLTPLPKKKLGAPNTEGPPQEIWNFPNPWQQDAENFFNLHKKSGFVGEYIPDRSTNYHKVVRVRDQKWEIVEITIIIFFLVWDSYWLFFIK